MKFFSEDKIKYSKSLIRTSVFHSSFLNLIQAYHPENEIINPKSFEEALMSTFYDRKGISAILLSDDINNFIKENFEKDTIEVNEKDYRFFGCDIITLENKNKLVEQVKKGLKEKEKVICIISINTPNDKMQMRIWHIMNIFDLLRNQEGNFELHTLFLIKPIDDVSLCFPQTLHWPCIYLDDLRGPGDFGLKDLFTKGPADWKICNFTLKSKSLSKPILGLSDDRLNENSWLYVKLLPTNSIIHTTKELFETDQEQYNAQNSASKSFQCFWEQYPIEKVGRNSVENGGEEERKYQRFMEYWQELLSYDWIDQSKKDFVVLESGDGDGRIYESLFQFLFSQEGRNIKNEGDRIRLTKFIKNIIGLFFGQEKPNKILIEKKMKFIVKTDIFNIIKNLYRLDCIAKNLLEEGDLKDIFSTFFEQRLDPNDELLVKRTVYLIRLCVFEKLCVNVHKNENSYLFRDKESKTKIYNILSYLGKPDFEIDMMNSQKSLPSSSSDLINKCRKYLEKLDNECLNQKEDTFLYFDVPPNVQIVLPIDIA